MGFLNLARQLKLDNSLFTAQYAMPSFPPSYLSRDELKKRCERELILSLADLIIKKYSHAIKHKEEICRIELVAFPMSEFKTVVEEVISLMPMTAIHKIKNREQIDEDEY